MSYRNQDPNNRLVVANRAQKMLFLHEIQGQLSDGAWENSRPHDHWEVWCALEDHQVLINADASKIGRNFWPRRDRYALANPELLDIIGDRMVLIARLATAFDFDVADKMQSLWNVFDGCKWMGLPSGPSEYYGRLRVELAKYDLDEVRRIGEDSSLYDRKMFKADLKQLAVAMRTYQAIK